MFQVGFHEEKGLRPTMEDALIINSSFNLNNEEFGLFSVIDGHGGNQVAEFVSKHFENVFQKKMESAIGIEDGLTKAFEQVDLDLKIFIEKQGKFTKIGLNCGAAAIVVFITKEKVYCANLGDCRALLFIDNAVNNCECVELSRDHKAGYEKERFEEMGVKVVSTLPSRTVSTFVFQQVYSLNNMPIVWRFSIQATCCQDNTQQTKSAM